jgi:hypothetical protein
VVPTADVTVIVEPPPEVISAGENDTRAPGGAPVAVRDTDWEPPVVTAVEMAVVVALPDTTEADDGVALIEKSGSAVTLRVNVVEWVVDVPVPVTVIGYDPGVVPGAVVTVIVQPPPEVISAGENETRAPGGAPVAVRDTDWGPPVVTAVEIAVVVALPDTTEADDGVAAIEKSGCGAVTVRVNVVE